MEQLRLSECVGRRVVLEFTDGERVEAKILSVDPDDHEDMIFDVVRVLNPVPDSSYPAGAVYRASLESIRRVEPAPDEP